MINICYSGGAKGADTFWCSMAEELGHKVINYSFNGHNTDAKNLTILTENELRLADSHIKEAAKLLNRSFPSNSYVLNLIRRNWYQVKDSNSIFSVSYIDIINKPIVRGGTAWAITMGRNIPNIYLFDQNTDKWFKMMQDKWYDIDQPPNPTGNWTGIGSRNIGVNGIKAIMNFME